MCTKLTTSASATTDSQCQHVSPKGQRCHMLIDTARPPNGAQRATLCAYHADRLKASVPAVDPEVLAAELLTDIDSFTTADEVNLFLGNLVRQLARKRIARRDAIALAYISQLILTSQTAMARQRADEPETESEGVLDTSSLNFAKEVANLPHAAISNRPPPRSPPKETHSAPHKGPVAVFGPARFASIGAETPQCAILSKKQPPAVPLHPHDSVR